MTLFWIVHHSPREDKSVCFSVDLYSNASPGLQTDLLLYFLPFSLMQEEDKTNRGINILKNNMALVDQCSVDPIIRLFNTKELQHNMQSKINSSS